MLKEVKIDNRRSAYLGSPGDCGKQPPVIHLHERYGIIKHTTEEYQPVDVSFGDRVLEVLQMDAGLGASVWKK